MGVMGEMEDGSGGWYNSIPDVPESWSRHNSVMLAYQDWVALINLITVRGQYLPMPVSEPSVQVLSSSSSQLKESP